MHGGTRLAVLPEPAVTACIVQRSRNADRHGAFRVCIHLLG